MDCSIIGYTTPKLSATTFQHRQQSKPWSRLHHTGRKNLTGALQPPASPTRTTYILTGQINMVGRDSVNDHHKWDEVVSAECSPDFSIPASTLAPLGVRSRALPRLRSNPSHRSLRIGEYRFRPQMGRPLYRRWRQPSS